MDTQATREFIAHGEITRGDISIPATIVGKYPSHGLGNVQCKIVVETANWPPDFGDPLDYQKPMFSLLRVRAAGPQNAKRKTRPGTLKLLLTEVH